jgi:L-asparaginase
MQAIRILCVGGTIDKVYFDALSEYEVGVPYALEMLEELNLNLDCRVTSLMRKDSLEMDDADRELVRDAVAKTDEELIVITHGTDTMVNTAGALSSLYKDENFNKTLVLTGALAPAIFKKSDAYIAMSGQVFAYDAVKKDREGQRFVAI